MTRFHLTILGVNKHGPPSPSKPLGQQSLGCFVDDVDDRGLANMATDCGDGETAMSPAVRVVLPYVCLLAYTIL